MQVAFRKAPLRIECARVGGVEIPNQKYLEFSLQYIYGIGPTTSKAIIAATVRRRCTLRRRRPCYAAAPSACAALLGSAAGQAEGGAPSPAIGSTVDGGHGAL